MASSGSADRLAWASDFPSQMFIMQRLERRPPFRHEFRIDVTVGEQSESGIFRSRAGVTRIEPWASRVVPDRPIAENAGRSPTATTRLQPAKFHCDSLLDVLYAALSCAMACGWRACIAAELLPDSSSLVDVPLRLPWSSFGRPVRQNDWCACSWPILFRFR